MLSKVMVILLSVISSALGIFAVDTIKAGMRPALSAQYIRDYTHPDNTISNFQHVSSDMHARIDLSSPSRYQVFQRQTRFHGQILCEGVVHGQYDTVEARITGNSLRGQLVPHWQRIAGVNRNHHFYYQMATIPGGWYTVEVRATYACHTVSYVHVENVGVGEVFITAGQSNSTNCGQFRTVTSTGMVSAFSGSDWRLANDPLPGAHDASHGGSCWPAFGDAMYERYHVPIGIAMTGHAGTSVKLWRTDGPLFHWFLMRVDQLGHHGFRAVLWHQGEADVRTDPNDYYTHMAKIINTSQRAAGWHFHWFVARTSYISPSRQSNRALRDAQKRVWDSGIALEGPDTDTLTGAYRDHNGQGIHFSMIGLQAHGRLWADKVSCYLDILLQDE
jgi:hypothetical protein